MSTARAGTPGATRVCPHCKAVVLDTAAVCPGCRHHLRFNSADAQVTSAEAYCAFNIEGTIAHKQPGEHCEYCIVLDIRNERGEQVIRQVVGVGALHPGELRRLNLMVEMLPVRPAMPKPEPVGTGRDSRAINKPAAPARPAAAVATSPPNSIPPPAPTMATPGRSAALAPAAQAAISSTPARPQPQSSGPSPAAPATTVTATGSPSATNAVAAGSKAPAGTTRDRQPELPLSQRLRIFRKP